MTTDEVVMPSRDQIDRELEADNKARIERKYKCSDCGREYSPSEDFLYLSWERDWAAWGVIREFLVHCNCYSSYEAKELGRKLCKDDAKYHCIPLYNMEGIAGHGFFDDEWGFIEDLKRANLRVSPYAVRQLADLCYPDKKEAKETAENCLCSLYEQ